MDIVTDLTAEAIAYITLFQDILKSNPPKELSGDLDSEEEWFKIVTEYFKDKLLTANQEEQLKDLVWHSAAKYDPGLLKERYFAITAKLMQWLADEVESIPSEQSLLKWFKTLFTGKNTEVAIFQPPFQWRQQIRHVLYKTPQERLVLAETLNYMPVQVILALFGKDHPSDLIRLYQVYDFDKNTLFSKEHKDKHDNFWAAEVNAHRQNIFKKNIATTLPDIDNTLAAELLLVHDDMLLDELKFREFTLPFETLYRDELIEIAEARKKRMTEAAIVSTEETEKADAKNESKAQKDIIKPDEIFDPLERAQDMNLMGLAFSGGGIRSATFNLGIIQRLASLGLLHKFDYISTVSGGGYIGTWLSSWIKRTGSVNKVADRLCPDKSADPWADEVRPIRWLRMYSNYLSPNASIMSSDAWASGMTWFRNTLINQVVLLLCLLTVLSFIDDIYNFWEAVIGVNQKSPLPADGLILMVTAIMFIPGIILTASAMSSFYLSTKVTSKFGSTLSSWYNQLTSGQTLTPHFLVIWSCFCALIVSTFIYKYHIAIQNYNGNLFNTITLFTFIALILVAFYGNYHKREELKQAGLANQRNHPSSTNTETENATARFLNPLKNNWQTKAAIILSSAVAAKAFTALLKPIAYLPDLGKAYFINNPIEIFKDVKPDAAIFLLGVPLVMELFALTVIIRMALMGNLFPDHRREWWGRVGGYIHRFILIWVIVSFMALMVPTLWHNAHKIVLPVAWGGWLGVIGWGVKKAFESRDEEASKGPNLTSVFLKVVPFIFMIGVLLIGSWLLGLLHPMGEMLSNWLKENHIPKAPNFHLGNSLLTLVLLAITFLLSWRVGVNEFSLHHFYRNRLIRAYLGATRTREERLKTANPFTGFDTNDDVLLKSMCTKEDYFGPFPIINAALNATVVSALDRQDRKAESFIFSPLYCGFDFSPTRSSTYNIDSVYEYGYRPTDKYANENGGPTLGTAMAISGAAVNPNWGYHSSATMAFLLTLFNVRLGWWMGNPRLKKWKNSDPKLGLLYLMRDLIGKSDINMDYVCLSDGGHFDNMGLYELIRRRCQYIILGDGEQDPKGTCEGLANAVRRCRIDFGVEIIEVRDNDADDGEKEVKKAHISYYTIKYPGSKVKGQLIYIKTSLTGDEPVDIREYAAANPDFPQQSTGDQFFDEAQFESYRKLGFHSIKDEDELKLPR